MRFEWRELILPVILISTCSCIFAIAVYTLPVPPTLPAYGEADPRNQQYDPEDGDCDVSAITAIASPVERGRREHRCEKAAEDYRQATNDLIQQTRAADAANAQAKIASQQLWAG